MALPSGAEICLIVPAGSFDVEPLIGAVRGHHPDVAVCAVWGGDPHHRPSLPLGVRWADLVLDEPSGAGWGRLLVALPPRAYEWARGCRAVVRRLAGGVPCVVVVRVGSTAVLGPVDAWCPATGLAALERAPRPMPIDGLAPSDHDLTTRGRWSVSVLGAAADAAGAIEDFGRLVAASRPGDEVGLLLQLALDRSEAVVAAPASGIAVGWWSSSGEIDVVDVDDVDRAGGNS